jgi:titin
VVLTWADNSSNEALFHIEREINGAFQQIQTVGANVTTATVTNLAAASTHYFRVRAGNASGYSAYSNAVYVITLNTNPTTPAPAAPNKLTAQALSASEIQLTWRDNSSNEAAFRIERKVGSVFQEVLVVGANTTSATISGLSPRTSYSFRVRASNAGGFSAYSNTANATTKVGTTTPSAMAAPTEAKAYDLGGGTVQLTWKDNSTAETRFEVERMVNGVYEIAARTARNATSTKVSGLRRRASYTFRVRATNTNGQESYSAPVNINTH